jgi:uncharacterized heparinase superfamily protein
MAGRAKGALPAPQGLTLQGDPVLKLRRRVAEAFYASPVYNLLLRGRHPHGLEVVPPDPWPGDADQADALFQGRYRFAGVEVTAPNAAPWEACHGDAPESWIEEMQGFAWLRHFAARGGDAAKRQARGLVDSWIRRYPQWDALAWRPDLIGRRLMSWASHGDFIVLNTELTYRSRVLDSMARQARHLSRAVLLAPEGAPRLTAIIGLAFAGLALPDGRRRLGYALRLLERELGEQILGDGGHVSRNPTLHMAMLRDLVALRAALIEGHHDVPQPVQNAIDRMAPMLRFYRHGDGGLALFNGSREQGDGDVDITLAQAEARGQPLSSAPHTGFERLTRNRVILLMDTGAPPPATAGTIPHAGMLSFEMSAGKNRVVVNCGAPESGGGEWSAALRATAAHSTLTVADASQFEPEALLRPVVTVTRRREEGDGNTLVDAAHDGYRDRFGIDHRRRLFLDESGNDVRGEDTLAAVHSGRGRRKAAKREDLTFAARFHLHPAVTAGMQEDDSVLLQLPGGNDWRFVAAGGTVSVEESVYLGNGEPRRCRQIVITGILGKEDEEAVVKWALRRTSAQMEMEMDTEAEPETDASGEPTLPGLDL